MGTFHHSGGKMRDKISMAHGRKAPQAKGRRDANRESEQLQKRTKYRIREPGGAIGSRLPLLLPLADQGETLSKDSKENGGVELVF